MSVVSSIRDYVDFLNTLSDSLGNEFTSTKFITETCFYFLKTFQYCVYYVFSLQWLRDFTLLPVIIPQISHAIFSENLFLESPEKIFFEFLEIPSINENKFILGFFNSFFLTLPITVTHIIAFRRLIIQGIPAAVFSFLGFILGQTLFILCVIFGIRSILIPWLSLEPFNYFLGLILIFQVVYNMVGENLTPLKWEVSSHQDLFKKFFIINLLLSWCEQSCIFQYFSNLNLAAQPSFLEGFSTKTTLTSFFSHSNYILGIFIGSILFSCFWGFFILQIKNLIVSFTGISVASFVQFINRTSFIVVLGFTLSSIPFYGLDYLLTGPLGFVSQDRVFQNTIFSQNQLIDPLSKYLIKQKLPFNFDISPFDRGEYLVAPVSDPYSFEDLNYRGELDWNLRIEKQSNIADTNASFLSITKIFKKQKDQQSSTNVDLNSQETNLFEKWNSLLPEPENFNYSDSTFLSDRFQDWYDFKKGSGDLASDPMKQNNSIKEVFDNFNLHTFSSDFLRQESVYEANIEKKIKQKYYQNPIYKNLLALDIDNFLNRQPSSFYLGENFERDLYKKRFMLNSYYDSLRIYSDLPESQKSEFNKFFDGTKSFTNKVYNQQFKGTLRSIRRLFSLQLTQDNNIYSVFKYDQPLYENKFKFSPYHEELPELDSFDEKNRTGVLNPFLTEFLSKPLYAGWDENLRKFVITNKLLPRANAGYEFTIQQDWYNKFNKSTMTKQGDFNKNLSTGQKINFSVWPKSEQIFEKHQPELPFVVLFDEKIDKIIDESFSDFKYKSLPSNAKIIAPPETQQVEKDSKTGSIFAILASKRGGFIWPGTYSFDFKNIFK